MRKLLIILIAGAAAICSAEKMVFELSTGRIVNLEPDAARVCDGRLESRVVSRPDWSKVGFGQGNDLIRTNTQAIIKPVYDAQSNLVGSVTNFYISTQQKDNIKDVSDFQKLYPITESERQAAKPAALKKIENKYVKYCKVLSDSTNNAAISLDDIETNLTAVKTATNKVARILEFILIDAAGRQLAGNNWTDDVTWHSDVEK